MKGNNELRLCTTQMIEIVQFWIDRKAGEMGKVSGCAWSATSNQFVVALDERAETDEEAR